MEAFATSRPKSEVLQEIVMGLQKFAVSHRSLPIYAYDRSDLSHPLFATERCTALRDKVAQFHGIRVSDVFEVNVNYKGCQMELCFFVRGSCENNLFFTAGYYNPTATDELAVKLLDAANTFDALDSIGFAVSLSDDDFFKINEYVSKIADVLIKRLQQSKRDYDSCADERREDLRLNEPRQWKPEEYAKMSDDAFKRFFLTPDEKAKEEKEAAEAAERSTPFRFRFNLPSSRLPKPNLIDLTSEGVADEGDPTECLDDAYFDLNVSDIGEDGVSFDNLFDKTCRLGWDTTDGCSVNSEKAESEEFKKWFSGLNDTVPDGHEDLAPPSKLRTGMNAILGNMMSEDPRYAELIESVQEIVEAMERDCTETENSQQRYSPSLSMKGLNISEPQSDHHQGAANYYLNKSARDYGNERYSGSASDVAMPVLGRGSVGSWIHLSAETTTPKSKLFENNEVANYQKKFQEAIIASYKIPKKEQSSKHSSRASLPVIEDITSRPLIDHHSLLTKRKSHFAGERGRMMVEKAATQEVVPGRKTVETKQGSAGNAVIKLKDDFEEETGDEKANGKRKLKSNEEEPEKKKPNKIFTTKPDFNCKRDGSRQ